jgi:alpha-glucosidase
VQRLPVFVKAGALLPMQPQKQNTQEKTDTLVLHVYAGTGRTSFMFYEDDGETFDYQQGAFAKRDIVFDGVGKKITLAPVEGRYVSLLKKLKIVFHGLHTPQVDINGTAHVLLPEINRFFAGLEKFDPIIEPEPAPQEDVLSVEFPYTKDAIAITW